jgi:ribosomal protein S18 acetylase RimI-like enzyme
MTETDNVEIKAVNRPEELPGWAGRDALAEFLHLKMQPWHDTLPDVHRGLDYAFSEETGKGGFVVLAGQGERLAGALVMLHTGMGGYVPEHLLLFVGVDPELRGQGIGRRLIERAIELCPGAVKLHVEPENRAKNLYERVGFTNKYLEMRFQQP